MTWEQQHALCEAGNLTALLALIEDERNPIEREVLYVSSVNMTHSKHPRVAVAIGTRYVEEFYKTQWPFGEGHLPDGRILKRLALLFDPASYEDWEEYLGDIQRAIWVCEFAVAFGVSDGTKAGFKGRLESLRAGGHKPS